MLPDDVLKLLKKHKFVTIATSSLKARPSAAPKFLLEIENNYIYLVDYYVNRSWKNLIVNSKAVISLFDEKTLTGYQIKGRGIVLNTGEEYNRLKKILDRKIHDNSVDRVIEAVRSGVKSEGYEISMPARIVILKVDVKEISIIGIAGKVKREEVDEIKVIVEKQELKSEIRTEQIPLLSPATLEDVYEDLTTINTQEADEMKDIVSKEDQ